MRIEIEGDASAGGWPVPDCGCASCGSAAAAPHAAFRVRVDGVPLDRLEAAPVPGGCEVRAPSGALLLCAAPGGLPEPVSDSTFAAVLLDLLADPFHLGALRARGAVGAGTAVYAVHVDHRVRNEAELARRLEFWRRPPTGRTLLLGGSRSGKSAEAELRLSGHPRVTYVATGPVADSDPDWARRVGAHRERRPAHWGTLETTDLVSLLSKERDALLIDGLGTWLAATMDTAGAWDSPEAALPHLDALVSAWRATRATVVAVTDEVGLSLVPETRSGRLFRDLLGALNQRLADASESVALVVAGRVLPL
ncbi:bifunctional adenosylcobinamide kinase/adenosylcobinamide-phosphate guanylyltransferase [Actinocorallia sp. API 0066]|uniref:bifunctional adenosylcobinamide kinase/adenosylcobinamide-phosphate guanylyltransferase n=1 Tax=Actinocorallia sp. API 0066 TaxID=2896846 RepID=UPI001E3B0965|nr:bifunctional adenosylcobinamide kinase/adenosylcobinamide-phosphate guanylyltransferase [Actinocorallia sp. API 0066]MCD0451010.1 bifunctional adenosylcobinamide kinase/adenosylcobinamide-phosphate guanylyltransferase [Actinocorallia sp. API 0066]